MKQHADYSEKVVLFTKALPWLESPMPGVQRPMLERDGAELARATAIVRYAPGSHLQTHHHGGGVEFIVLEGVFSDEHGDNPAGTCVRNPVGSSHTPFRRDGCTILVKLWQMHPHDP
jgi:anti-sigma factor ChrR (cupin superfamily)